MVVDFIINYDGNNSNGVFHDGQVVSGTVKIISNESIAIRGAYLKISGVAKSSWSETMGTGNGTITIHYSGKEKILENVTYLIGSDGVGQTELAAGDYTYNFSCLLPPLVPTSLEEKNGYIRYTIKVVLDRPWKFNLSYKQRFTVIKTLNLNDAPTLHAPVKAEVFKKFSFSFGGNFLMSACIPMAGFVAGQRINVTAEINNQSNIDIDYLKISLRKNLAYKSDSPFTKTKNDMRTVHEMFFSGVKSKTMEKYDENFVIPITPPTNINTCEIVKVWYELQFKAKVKGMHRSPFIRFPVVIGTIPILSNNAGTSTQQDCEAPPPSYEEFIALESLEHEKDDDDGENVAGHENFNLRYPVYKFNDNFYAAQNQLGDGEKGKLL